MGQSQTASPPTPQQGAEAQAMAQAAGTQFNIATSPMQALSEAITQLQFNPEFQQIQSATNANSARNNALANTGINAQINPYGTAGGRAFSKEAAMRLANVMGQPFNPGLTSTPTETAFQYPQQSQLPDLNQIEAESRRIANAVPTINFNGANQPSLKY